MHQTFKHEFLLSRRHPADTMSCYILMSIEWERTQMYNFSSLLHAHGIDSLSMRVTDFLLNDSDKKNGFLENSWFLSLQQRTAHQSVSLVRLSKPIKLIRGLPFTDVNRIDQCRNTETRDRSFNFLRRERGNSILMDHCVRENCSQTISRSDFYEICTANKANFSFFCFQILKSILFFKIVKSFQKLLRIKRVFLIKIVQFQVQNKFSKVEKYFSDIGICIKRIITRTRYSCPNTF